MGYLIKELLIPFIKEFYINNEEFRRNIRRPKVVGTVIFVGGAMVMITHWSITYLKERDGTLNQRYKTVYEEFVELQGKHLKTLGRLNDLEVENNALRLENARTTSDVESCLVEKEVLAKRLTECGVAEQNDDLATDPVSDLLDSLR